MAICAINAGITNSCDDLRRVGGVNKRLWVFNPFGVSYTIDGDGYVTGITFPAYGGTYKFESQKNSHSGGSQLIVTEGGNRYFQHDVIMKVLATTPTDDEVIEQLAVGQNAFIMETRNNEFFIFGATQGLDLVTGIQNSGAVANSDISDVLTFQGEEKVKPLRVLLNDFAPTLTLLESYEI